MDVGGLNIADSWNSSRNKVLLEKGDINLIN